MPESYDNMIKCDLCLVWFHMGCIDLNKQPEGEWLQATLKMASKYLRTVVV